MKITCDLCGGTLQMNPGGQTALCTGCGLCYPMARLREKLVPPPVGTAPVTAPEATGSIPVTEPVPAAPPSPDTQPFALELHPGRGDLSGLVLQGGIGLGDRVYIDMDYDHPYTVYCINDDPGVSSVKAGEQADLFVRERIPRRLLRNARLVTGDPVPVPSAYNAPGGVQEYFHRLLLQEFPAYELRRDVILTDPEYPAAFLLCRQDKTQAAVFLLSSDDTRARRHVEAQGRRMKEQGVACTHFFSDYRNDTPYVVQRVRDILP